MQFGLPRRAASPEAHTGTDLVSEHWLGKSGKTQMRSGKVGLTGGGQQAFHLGRPHARYLWLPVTPRALSCMGQGGCMDPPPMPSVMDKSVLGSSPWPVRAGRLQRPGDRLTRGTWGPAVEASGASVHAVLRGPGCGRRWPRSQRAGHLQGIGLVVGGAVGGALPSAPERVASVPSPACCLMSPRSHSEHAALLCVVTVTLVAL